MEIPIQNIYFLLCYAWDKLEERELVDVDPVGVTELVDLFSRVLISGTNHLLKRGFDRNYVLHEEQTARLKGKIRFEAVVKAGMPTATLPCEFDELSYDVVHNRILKATARRLMRADSISKENAEELAALCRQFPEVRDVELTGQIFGQVELNRNNQFYDFLMKLCELIHHNLLVSETRGRSRFRDFTRDRRQMGGAVRELREELLQAAHKIPCPSRGYPVEPECTRPPRLPRSYRRCRQTLVLKPKVERSSSTASTRPRRHRRIMRARSFAQSTFTNFTPT